MPYRPLGKMASFWEAFSSKRFVCCAFIVLYSIYTYAAVEAHSCIDIVAKFTDEQYTTINQCFDPRVFVNCLQVEKCCERRLFIWLQSGDVTNACVNKVNTDWFWYKTEVTLVEGVIG